MLFWSLTSLLDLIQIHARNFSPIAVVTKGIEDKNRNSLKVCFGEIKAP